MLLDLNLINQILASGWKVFAGINIASIFNAFIIEECILPQLNVYFWLMMLPLILRWSLLLSDIKFRATEATIPHQYTLTFKCNTWFVHFFPLAPDKLWHKAYDNTETKSFPNNQTGPQDIATAVAHDSIISRKKVRQICNYSAVADRLLTQYQW